MLADAAQRRGGRPTLAMSVRDPESVARLCAWVETELTAWRAGLLVAVDPGPPAPHRHGDDGVHRG